MINRIIKKIKRIYFSGDFKEKSTDNNYGRDVLIDPTTLVNNCVFEDSIFIGKESIFFNCEFGRYTYFFGYNSGVSAKVGRFCSIARGVHLGLGMHPVDSFVSTSPVFFSKHNMIQKSFSDREYFDGSKEVTVGNDVWIGANALIKDGVKIGDGAIIGAGSVVTKDVLPYEIVAGVPAKRLRMRFSEEDVKFLQATKWWEKDEEWLREHFASFHSVESFKTLLKND